jgi:hypothetical protein
VLRSKIQRDAKTGLTTLQICPADKPWEKEEKIVERKHMPGYTG